MLTVTEVAERLSIRPSLIYQLCASGELTHSRVGNGRGVIRISDEDVDEYLKRKTRRGGVVKQPCVGKRTVKLRNF